MRLIVLGDLHYAAYKAVGFSQKSRIAARENFYGALFAQVAQHQADMVLAIGDCTHYGTLAELEALNALACQHGLKLVSIVGNHDAESLEKGELAPYFLGGVLSAGTDELYNVLEFANTYILLLDSARVKTGKSDWSGYIGAEQLAWLETQIAFYNQAKQHKALVVAAHHPIFDTTQGSTWDMMYITNSKALVNVLSETKGNSPRLFLCGHNHTNSIFEDTVTGWLCVQSGAPLTCLSYRWLEVDGNGVQVETLDFDTSAGRLEQDRLTIAKAIPQFWIPAVSLVAGQPTDRTFPLKIISNS